MRMDGGLWVPGAVAPGTPGSGNIIYPKADGQWYTKDASAVENLVGSKLVPTAVTGTDSANKSYVDAQITALGAGYGQELGYASRTTNFTSTNTTLFATGAAITSLSVGPITGTGRAVDIEFYCISMGHSANVIVTSYLIVNGVTNNGNSQFRNWVTSFGEGGSMRQRLTLTNGTNYTFTVGVSGAAGGTITVGGSTSGQMWLGVVGR